MSILVVSILSLANIVGAEVNSSSTPLSVTCTASPEFIYPGESVTWTVNATGGTGTYTYRWKGSGIEENSSSSSLTKTYNENSSVGKKIVVVKVTSGQASKSVNCVVDIRLNVGAKIACVGAAVNARETAIKTAVGIQSSAMLAAYEARATALQAAYALTDLKQMKEAVKTAWSNFNKSKNEVVNAWKTARNNAWQQYRTTAVACKAPEGTGDGSNSVKEISGN